MTELVRDSLDHCVKCTICESFCPYAAATPLFPGPKYVGPQAERFRRTGVSPDTSVDYCSGCGICTAVCPQGVKIAEINSQARAHLMEDRGIPLRNQLIARPSTLGRAISWLRRGIPRSSHSWARACELISAIFTPCGQTAVQIPQPEQ